MAGESAEAVARRQRAKAERLMRASERWAKGAAGERVTAAALEALPREKWRVLHDIPWPGRPRASLDHVVIGPPGVFVIDTKNWSGTVAVRNGVLRQHRYSRQAVVTSAAEAGRAVARVVRTASCPVHPVLCLVRDEPIADTSDGVLICSTATVVDQLLTRRPVLADVQVQRVARDLAGQRLPTLPLPPANRAERPRPRSRYVVGALAALTALTALTIAVSGLGEDVFGLLGD
jgi:hypothetical protein